MAGSSRNYSQVDLGRGRRQGRATDWMFRGRDPSASCQTPNLSPPSSPGVRARGVNSASARERTQPEVKVPKRRLSAIERASVVKDSGEVGLEAATLQRKRNSSPAETTGTENGRG